MTGGKPDLSINIHNDNRNAQIYTVAQSMESAKGSGGNKLFEAGLLSPSSNITDLRQPRENNKSSQNVIILHNDSSYKS